MPIVPNFIERTIFLSLNQGPGPVLDIWNAVAFRTVLAAIRLDVFEALAANPMSTAELAQCLNADARGVQRLLDALVPLGYVRRQGDRYTNTPMTIKWLLRSSPTSFAPYFRYWGAIIPKLMDDLEDSIKQGRAPRNLYEWIEHEPEVSRDFQEAMIALANFALGDVIGKLQLPGSARRLLDVGGGHAMYSVALCQKYPQLSAVVFDSPQALATGRVNIDRAGLADRVTVQTGNFFRDELGSGYDAALLFNIIHGNSPDQNIELFRKAARALNPGGQLIVLEQLAGKALLPIGNAVNGLLGLSYFHLLQGSLYSFDEVARWYGKAGFNAVRRINLLKAAGSSLIIGTKAS
jgi:SAM-dependent methyltransferase